MAALMNQVIVTNHSYELPFSMIGNRKCVINIKPFLNQQTYLFYLSHFWAAEAKASMRLEMYWWF